MSLVETESQCRLSGFDSALSQKTQGQMSVICGKKKTQHLVNTEPL